MKVIKCSKCEIDIYYPTEFTPANPFICNRCIRMDSIAWSDDELDRLIYLRTNTSLTIKEIAKELGRTPLACERKIHLLGISKMTISDNPTIRCILCDDPLYVSLRHYVAVRNCYICRECRHEIGKIRENKDGFEYIKVTKDTYLPIHVLVWLINKNTLKNSYLIHKNKNNKDNRIENLCLLTIDELKSSIFRKKRGK